MSTALVLFEPATTTELRRDPVNTEWLAACNWAWNSPLVADIEARFYPALTHFRSAGRPPLPGQMLLDAESRHAARRAVLEAMEQRKAAKKKAASNTAPAIFVDPTAGVIADDIPPCLRDFAIAPPRVRDFLDRPGRPPVDAGCLLRAFLVALILTGDASPTAVHRLLHSNPTVARECGFLGLRTRRLPGEYTSRRVPSPSTLEEFDEVMTRYGLWHRLRLAQVSSNLESGVIPVEDTLVFDTTHVEANSHCTAVVLDDDEGGKKPRQRKVCRLRKTCNCGERAWETCEHGWQVTDAGAAVVVKGPTRVYWAHKTSHCTFGDSEIPLDIRAMQHASDHDSKTLPAHIDLLKRDLPRAVSEVRHVLADDGYQGNRDAVAERLHGARLSLPVHPDGRSKAHVAERFDGIERFTRTGVPVCAAGHHFEMRGRDITQERYIWAAPDGSDGRSVCDGCPFAETCKLRGTRRHVRVDRSDFPQIDWDHPQHLARERARYARRTGIERAIKRLKVDLGGEDLTHRDALRVQAHFDKRLLLLHVLLAIEGGG